MPSARRSPAQPSQRQRSAGGGRAVPRAAEEPSHSGGAGDAGRVGPDARVAAIATAQRGVVTTQDLRGAGLTRHDIDARVRRGWLHRRHRGVYAVGHLADIPFAAETAALLACGAEAVVSHRSAAALFRLLPSPARPELTLPHERRSDRSGIVVHRTTTLRRDEVWVREGLRVTNPRRTLHDLAAVATPEELRRAVNEAHALRLIPPGPLDADPGRAGVQRLRSAAGETAKGYTRSKAERLLRALVRKAGLPAAETNVKVAGVLVDAVWRAERLVVEVDGGTTHAHQLDRDRRNEARLRTAGFEVVRFTWRQLTEAPHVVVAQIALRLGARARA